jgi:hypothetical protein
MAIENTYLLGKNITLGCGFDLQAKAPLDSRQTVPAFAGLQALIDNNAAYEGMIVYDEETKKTYQAQIVDDVLKFREFGINEAELKDLIASETTAAMEFKGAATALPENPAKGDMYKVTASFKVGEEDVKVGDSIVYDGEQWFIIPSGDDIEDTWRPVTGVDNDSTLTFVAGDKLEKTVAADGTITYKHVAIDAPTNMNEEGDEHTRTYITQLITDNHGHIIGFKTATENVEDTNTTYEFEGLPVVDGEGAPSSVYFQVKSSEEEAADVIYLDAYSKNEADAKFVEKEEGKSLISTAEIQRLTEVDNYDDEEVRGLIGNNAKAIEDLGTYVGTIPNVPGEDGNNKYADLDVIGYINKKAQETLAAASGNSSETAASVKGQLDDYIGENNTRVGKIEGAIEAINHAETGILKQAQDYADGLAGNYDEAGAAAGVKGELEIEIAKKVDKVEGKSLVLDTEITKLAGVSEGANKVENVGGGKIKIDGEEVVVYAHPEKHSISEVDGLQDALDGKQAAGNYSEVGHKHVKEDITDFAHTHVASEITDLDSTYATKTELGNVDKKFENYKTAEAQKAIDDKQDERLDVIEGEYLKAADIAEFETKANVKKVADDLAGYIESNDAAVALKADKSVVEAMYTNGQIDGFLGGKVDKATYEEEKATFALKSEITSLADKADKSYVDEELAKKVNVSDYNNEKVTFATKTELNGVSERVAVVEGILNDAGEGEELTKGLVSRVADLETIDHDQLAKDASAAAVATVLDGAPEKFDTLKEIAAWIAEADTAEDAASLVTRVSELEATADDYIGADSALKSELEGKINGINNHSHTFVESELNEIKAGDVAKWNAELGAKELAASKTTTAEVKAQIEAYVYATEADLTLAEGRIADLEAIDHEAYIAADATLKSELEGKIAEAKTAAANQDAVVLAESQKYTNTAKAEAIADAEGKVNALAGNVYTKAQTYTQEEVNNLLSSAMSWGEF